MEKSRCSICNKKTTRQCGLCEAFTCKNCAHNIAKDHFNFLKEVPEDLTHGYYCNDCFVNKVSSDYETYNTILERAKNVEVYFKKKHSKEVRFFKHASKPLSLHDYKDYDELLLHMAFLAAKDGYNAIINVETSSRKKYDGSYKTVLWSGTGLPAKKTAWTDDWK